ncbi:MAG: protein phosphatase 2C domain-containing protein [Rhodospirillales bacterium]|nr:protein phosphatase 2C domain-containing protein [Rhodospirillales bacterium]
MKIEALSESRDPDRPDANEDSLALVPGRGLAVFDGVSDRTGLRFDGATSGRIASQAAAAAFEAFLALAEGDRSPDGLVAGVSGAIADVYARLGIAEAARADNSRRFGTTIAAAYLRHGDWVFVRVGDSGIRIDATTILQGETTVDRVTSALRAVVVAHLVGAGAEPADRAGVARICVLHGLGKLHPGMAPWIDVDRLGALRAQAVEHAAARVPDAAVAEVESLVALGVAGGQSVYANALRPPFGYGVIDGFPVPADFVHVDERTAASVKSLELFTDGYFELGAGPSIEAWERAADEVERTDPEKIREYKAPKGSLGRLRTDDRTVIVATF